MKNFEITSEEKNSFHEKEIIKNIREIREKKYFADNLLVGITSLKYEMRSLFLDGLISGEDYRKFLISLHFITLQLKQF